MSTERFDVHVFATMSDCSTLLKRFLPLTVICFLWMLVLFTSAGNCPADKFGWQCRFNCSCNGLCHNITGYCNNCPGFSWGPGCLLDSSCTYNDQQGAQYQGKRSKEDNNLTCIPWEPPKRGYTADKFPDETLLDASNYCRNPKEPSGYSTKPWCYVSTGFAYGYCTIGACSCPKGRFGISCMSECHCNDPANTCDPGTGQCTAAGCHIHFQEPLCQVCKDKLFGPHCDRTCRCENRTEVCDKNTGFCSSGCPVGWKGTDCHTECAQWQYGRNCNSNCSINCDPSARCDRKTGTCSCQAGYQPPLCAKECPQGMYGLNCTSDCSENCNATAQCDHRSGSCLCKAGYQPPLCVEECQSGQYGLNCTGNCSMNCDTPGECDKQIGHCQCQAGYQPPLCFDECIQGQYGMNCTRNCSLNCDTPGQCNTKTGVCTCQAGFMPPLCDSECSFGHYGLNCSSNCSVNCDTPGQCDKRSGTCLCQTGYQPPLCVDACVQGYYGLNCTGRCSMHCDTPGECNKGSGTCLCQAGYQHPKCAEACDAGEYGMNCTSTCSMGCEDICQNTNGSCSCKKGYSGIQCTQECKDGNFGRYCVHSCKCYNLTEVCDKESGSCDHSGCLEGLGGDGCLTVCESGTYGRNCNQKCADGCRNSSCNIRTGECECKENFLGPQCVDKIEAAGLNVGVIVSATLVPLIAIAVAVVLVLFWVRRHRGPKHASTHETSVTHREMVDIKEDIQPVPADDNVYCNLSALYDKTDIAVDVFPDYIRHMIDTKQAFDDEYKSIPIVLGGNCGIGNMAENRPKNRFKNIIPYDHNLVKLQNNNDPIQGYINASFITGYDDSVTFIAAQGPVPLTLNDFVLLLWENNVPLVVMLTSLKEKNKIKCEQYWPQGKEAVSFGNITVSMKNNNPIKKNHNYVTRELILQKDGKAKRVKHMQFTSWPDHGSPQSPAAFLNFHQETKKYYCSTKGPVLVHCSAGVGRTGTFLAMDYLLRQAEKEDAISIYNCVMELRKQRVNMVQSLDQYKFLHEALLEALHCGKVVYDSAGFEAWRTQDNGEILRKQFMMLEKLRRLPRLADTSAGRDPNNRNKNRKMSLLPLERWRPLLMMKVPSTTDYINAVFVKTAWSNDGILVTQSPLENTVVDLWRLIYDYECHIVIALNTFESQDSPKYIPNVNDIIGPFSVTIKAAIEEEGFIQTSLTYTIKQEETELVHQAVCTEAPPGALPDIATFLALTQTIQSARQNGLTGRILVHCRNGLEESGLFCALIQICHKIKVEGEVDIFHAVKQIRISRPEFITSLEEYQWLHEAACQYVRSFSTYANFQ